MSNLTELDSFETNFWHITKIKQEKTNPEYITGEGYGFAINIYDKVISITSYERFGSLYLKGEKYGESLKYIFEEIINEVGNRENIMLVDSSESEEIEDLAYYNKFSFEDIISVYRKNHGNPARKLTDLMENSWYSNRL